MVDRPHFVVVSNRLPIVLEGKRKHWKVLPGSGGLVSALAPILKDRGGLWIGWIGTSEIIDIEGIKTVLGPASEESGYRLLPVFLSSEEVELFYHGFSNEIVWPLFHGLSTRCNFSPPYWSTYLSVNRKFARVVVKHATQGDYVWVHDYHLIPLAGELSKRDKRLRCSFFLHIPFPPVDIFMKLPWRKELVSAFLEYQFVAFQTVKDREHFFESLKALFPKARIRGRGLVHRVELGNKSVGVGSFPISIDFQGICREASSPEVEALKERIQRNFPEGHHLMLGIDRLDYTKGIPERLKAFRLALEKYPELLEKITLFQVVVPSRQSVGAYRELKDEVERLVSQINGAFTQNGWIPIVYLYKSLDRKTLWAYYKAADVALVTPLVDGMNLVCKEYCTAHSDNLGTLVLSEFAGAALQLGNEALLVNPYDVEGVASAIRAAALMPQEEQRRRMKSLRRSIQRHDIFWWVDRFLSASLGRSLESFPETPLPPILPHKG